MKFLECYSCYMAFLDERIIKFILKLYGNKTKLKGVEGMETIYKRDKAQFYLWYGREQILLNSQQILI